MNLLQFYITYPFRVRKQIRHHNRCANLLKPYVERYFVNRETEFRFEAKKKFSNSKIIWQYWSGGTLQAPEMVQTCFKSVDQYASDYEIIRLNDSNFSEFIDIPDFILERRQEHNFNTAHFSDVLRLALLKVYGGIWLDATILLTGSLPSELKANPFFMYQRDMNESRKRYWERMFLYYFCWHPKFKVRILNSIIASEKNNPIINALLENILQFWKENRTAPHYFFFHILYDMVINDYMPNQNCEIKNDCDPHLLQSLILDGYPYLSYSEIMDTTNIHKLTYFKGKDLEKFNGLYQNQHLI